MYGHIYGHDKYSIAEYCIKTEATDKNLFFFMICVTTQNFGEWDFAPGSEGPEIKRDESPATKTNMTK